MQPQEAFHSCQDRLAELQANLKSIPSAIALSKASWDNRKDSLTRRATRAVRKISAHVLGIDKLGPTATAEDARRAFEGRLFSTNATTPAEFSKISSESSPEEVAAFFCFWVCEDLDEEFASWVSNYPRKTELAKLAERSPRVRLGLAPKVAEALPLGFKPGPPRRVAGYLVPTQLSSATPREEEAVGWVRLVSTETCTTREDEDPARDPAGSIPAFKCNTQGQVVFPGLDFTPQTVLELENPDETPARLPDKPTRGEFAQALMEIVQELPPIPKGAMDPWFVLRRLADMSRPAKSKKKAKGRSKGIHEKISKLFQEWPLDAESLPIPRVRISSPEVAWVETLERLADDCIPSIEFPLDVFKNVVPLGGEIFTPKDEDTEDEDEKKHRRKNRAWDLESLHSTWDLLNNALHVCGFPEVSFNDYKESKTDELVARGGCNDPLRCNAAWSRWQHALWRNFLESPDDLVPVTLGVLDWLTRNTPGLVDVLRWSAESASWAGKPVHTDPDGMWCAYRKIRLRLGKLKTLPESTKKSSS